MIIMESYLEMMAALHPDTEVAALVFCNPCSGLDGESVGTGKVMIVDTAYEIKQLSLIDGVKQVKLLGSLEVV